MSFDLALPPRPATSAWSEVQEWRRHTRKAIIDWRVHLAQEQRRARAAVLESRLAATVDLRRFATLGAYWPIRGEFDLLDLLRMHVAAGGTAALPVVVEKGAPVEFWRWDPQGAMGRGVWGIPIPRERAPVLPEALLVPLVGFDAARYRLGYGGGYYDRTLAALPGKPYCVGVGFAETQLATIHPQAHDIPMDAIVTA